MTSPHRPPLAPASPRPRSSPWLLRLALMVGVPLVFFGLLEGALRLAGFGTRPEFFIPDEDKQGFFCPNPDFTALFLPAHFGIRPLNFRLRKPKDPGSVRIFVLGESAAQGTPEPGFGFAAQLQAQLSAHYAGRKIEVVNLGITAINSHVVYQVARQLPDFEPDLLVVYMGNNEVIGPYGPGSAYLAAMPPLWAIRASVWARGTRTGQLILRLLPRFGGSGAETMEWRGMETFTQNTIRGNDPRLEEVYKNFERNLRDIADLAAGAGIKTVISTVVANLKDISPFVSLHRAGLTPSELTTWQTAFDDGLLSWKLEEYDGASARLNAALRLDPEYADTHYLLGRLAEHRGEIAAARQHYVDALHWDALRFRPDPRLNDIIRRVALEAGPTVRLVDAARVMGADAASADPISGHQYLFEHVHFNWEGNALVARLLAEGSASLLLPPSVPTGWLSPDECADAIGFSPFSRLTMLNTVEKLTNLPPFTNLLSFGENQIQLRDEIQRTRLGVTYPARLLLDTEARLTQALQRTPENPELMVLLAGIEVDLHNADRAISLIDQTMALQPRSALLIVQKAKLLTQANRPNEAVELLLDSIRRDPYFTPTWQLLVRIWNKQGKFTQAKTTLETLLAKRPDTNLLRISYAELLAGAGQSGPAEQEWQTVLQHDPSNTLALEKLVSLYLQSGRTAKAETLMLAASKFQPRNHDNNTRLAQLYAARGDSENMVIYLRALAESGPADASLDLELAQRLLNLHREREALVYARRGKKAAIAENNAELAQAADELLQHLTPS